MSLIKHNNVIASGAKRNEALSGSWGAPNEGKVWDEQTYNDNRYYKILENLDTLFNNKRRYVLHSGSWNFDANDCRSAYRSSSFPDFDFDSNGFRVVQDSFPFALLLFFPLSLSLG